MTIKYKTIKEIKKMISKKEISNIEVVQEVYKLIDENSHLNAFVTLNKDMSIKKAENLDNNPSQSPLAGIPIAQKVFFVQKERELHVVQKFLIILFLHIQLL